MHTYVLSKTLADSDKFTTSATLFSKSENEIMMQQQSVAVQIWWGSELYSQAAVLFYSLMAKDNSFSYLLCDCGFEKLWLWYFSELVCFGQGNLHGWCILYHQRFGNLFQVH